MTAPVRELSYAQAIQEALGQAMAADERVFLMGEDIGVYGGAFQVTGDLVHRFGEDRVMDAPISELGQAMFNMGLRVIGAPRLRIARRQVIENQARITVRSETPPQFEPS